jgi:Glycine/D-amino acid oxidases (deaminating)
MKEFDYVILGGGCAGLSLAYELDINNKIKNKKLAIVEIREEYKRDKTWSFWKVCNHNFDDCIVKSWNNFSLNSKSGSYEVFNKTYPYQTIDSELFYNKILNKIKQNKNIEFFKDTNQLNLNNSIIFNSILPKVNYEDNLWQHFKGIEIETSKNILTIRF